MFLSINRLFFKAEFWCMFLPWPSILIHSEMSDTDRVTCTLPLLKSWEGHVPPHSADPRWHVINSEMSDTSWVTCVPLIKLWEGCAPPPFSLVIHSEMSYTDGAICAPFSKVGRGSYSLLPPILAGFLSDTTRSPVFTPIINWLIN